MRVRRLHPGQSKEMSEDDPYKERGLAAPAPDYSDKQALSCLSDLEYDRAHKLRPEWFDPIEEGMSLWAARVDFIYDMIVTFCWDNTSGRRALQKIWGVRRNVIDDIAREARRRMASGIADPEELRGLCIEQIQYVTKSAMHAKKGMLTKDGDVVYVDAPDHKAAILGIDKIADYIGLKGPAKKGLPPASNLADASLEELVDLCNNKMKELRDKSNAKPIDTSGRPVRIFTPAVVSTGVEKNPDLYDSEVEE